MCRQFPSPDLHHTLLFASMQENQQAMRARYASETRVTHHRVTTMDEQYEYIYEYFLIKTPDGSVNGRALWVPTNQSYVDFVQ